MNITITGTGIFHPNDLVTNEELVSAFNRYVDLNQDQSLQYSSAEFIERSSGIKQRYVIDAENICDPNVMRPLVDERSDDQLSLQAEHAVSAAKVALQNAEVAASDIDCVICSCSNFQRAYPTIAIEVQHALGCGGFAFDMNAACSSAPYGINAAVGLLKSGNVKKVLVINPEITSPHLDYTDRDSHFIFGDATSACVLESSVDKPGFLVRDLCLQSSFTNNIRNNFGFLNRCERTDQYKKLFYQQGRKVFKEVVTKVTELLKARLELNSISVNDIKRFWLHQANANMNELIIKKVTGQDYDLNRAPLILNKFANTSSSGSMIAFHNYQDDLKKHDLAILSAFGAGYTLGCILLEKI
jgi:beta-ketodecanoyl-[acyl-carrier-protein] synthase